MSKKWRVNYVITYCDNEVETRQRGRILSALETIAHLQGIEIAVSERHQLINDTDLLNKKEYANSVTDLVYFRSLQDTAILPKEFRELMRLVFLNHQWIRYSDDFQVNQQLLNTLPDFPFPSIE